MPTRPAAIAVLALLSAGAAAQRMFQPPQDRQPYLFLPMVGALDYAVGDVDGDGWTDVALVSRPNFTGILFLLRQTALGWMRHQLDAIHTMQPRFVDLDGDGLLDILSVPEPMGIQPVVRVLRNRGGWFSAVAQLQGPTTEHGVACADFDGDGDRDLLMSLTVPQAGHTLQFWQQTAPFVWAPTVAPAGLPTGCALAAGDFDGDGDVDVFASAPQGPPVLLDNAGNAVFAALRDRLPPFPAGRSFHPFARAADLDGDGRDDAVLAAAATVDVLWGGPAPSLQTAVATGVTRDRFDLADLDADGDLDLVGHLLNGFAVTANLGGRAFGPGPSFRDTASASVLGVTAIGTGDIDGDGGADVLLSLRRHPHQSRVFWRGSQEWSDPVFERGFAITTGSPFGTPRTGDFDGDGRSDAVFPTIPWFGVQGHALSLQLARPGGRREEVAVAVRGWLEVHGCADFDGDGRDELLVQDGAETVVLGGSPGALVRTVLAGVARGRPHVVDLDGDGDPDLVRATDRGLVVHCAPGPLPRRGTPVANEAQVFAAGDFDGDGDADIATDVPGPGGAVLFANDGRGGFAPAAGAIVPLPAQVHELVAFDADGDGDLDLLAAVRACGGLQLLSNDGAGRFAAPRPLVTTCNVNGVQVADFDEDGDLDLAFEQGAIPPVAILENDGSGTFAAVSASRWGLGQESQFHAADFDDDGDVDLAFRTGIAVNHTRQLASLRQPGPGGRFELDVYTGPGYGAPGVYALLAAPAAGASALVVPGIDGRLQLEPATAAVVHVGPMGPVGVSRVFLAIPPVAALIGQDVHFQHVTLPSARTWPGFSNAVHERVLP